VSITSNTSDLALTPVSMSLFQCELVAQTSSFDGTNALCKDTCKLEEKCKSTCKLECHSGSPFTSGEYEDEDFFF
jgi:hypothetical protein